MVGGECGCMPNCTFRAAFFTMAHDTQWWHGVWIVFRMAMGSYESMCAAATCAGPCACLVLDRDLWRLYQGLVCA